MPTDPAPIQPDNGADLLPGDGPQDVPQDPGTVVESEVPDPGPDDERAA